jgi:hypothetical protein
MMFETIKTLAGVFLRAGSNPLTIPSKIYGRVQYHLQLRVRAQKARSMQIHDPSSFLYQRLPGHLRAHLVGEAYSGSSTALAISLCKYLASLLSRRLWLSPQQLQDVREYVLRYLPDAARRTVHRADCVCKGVLPVWGKKEQHLGIPIPWYRDPVSNKNWPLLYWECVRRKPVGDVDAVWEVGRHLFLPSLGRAFLYTGQEKYRRAYFDIVDDWIAKTPYAFGVHWASPLECATRNLSWLTALMPLLPLPEVYAVSFCNQIARLVQQTQHILENLYTNWEYPNNHLIGQCVGVLVVQLLLFELFPSDGAIDKLEDILSRELARQVDSQGLHRELCPFYHQFVLHLLVYLAVTYRRVGRPMPTGMEHVIQRMVRAGKALADSRGCLPFYVGDRGTAEMERFFEPEVSFKEIDIMSRILFDGKVARDEWTESVIWHTGVPTKERMVTEYDEEDARSTVLQDSGWCISRSGKSSSQWWLLFKGGSMGYGHAGHGHADALSICARVGEQVVLIDPGTFTYSGPQEWRNYFRSTVAHNTMRVNGREQATPLGVFDWDRRVDATLLAAATGDGWDFFAAYHDAYAPVRHTRFVFVVHQSFWVVLDYLSGALSSYTWELLWHLAPCEIIHQGEGRVVARLGDLDTILDVKANCPFGREIFLGSTAPIRGWFSPQYYVKVPSPTLVYKGETSRPCWAATLVVPGLHNVDAEWKFAEGEVSIQFGTSYYTLCVSVDGSEVYTIRASQDQQKLFTLHCGGRTCGEC